MELYECSIFSSFHIAGVLVSWGFLSVKNSHHFFLQSLDLFLFPSRLTIDIFLNKNFIFHICCCFVMCKYFLIFICLQCLKKLKILPCELVSSLIPTFSDFLHTFNIIKLCSVEIFSQIKVTFFFVLACKFFRMYLQTT